MTGATFYVGDVFDVLRSLPADSVDLVLTSPPFLALRSYLPDDHADKGREIGQEGTPGEFLGTLLRLTSELDRVLAPHGSLCVELGDSYSGAGGSGGDLAIRDKKTQVHRDTFVGRDDRDGWPLAKSLCGIPELYAFSLAYGRNLLTGEKSPAGMWRVRNLVRWVRPNPPVGALGDKFRPATSTMTIACRAKDRWFDLDAVRTELKHPDAAGTDAKRRTAMVAGQPRTEMASGSNPAGAPPLDWWEVPTQPYRGAHYATWPPALCVRPIESMCPREVCRTCGEPRRRLTEAAHDVAEQRPRRAAGMAAGSNASRADRGAGGFLPTQTRTVGWSDCGHDDYRRGVVLDPFAGSGTTLAVATGHGRDAVGIDLDERNADLARERVGMFLEVEQ